ncbi:MAG TPA: SH3 domain-containing protein [Leptolyngbyaceae cyanobacterium]
MKRKRNWNKVLTAIAILSLSAIGFKTISAALATPEKTSETPVNIQNNDEYLVADTCQEFWVLTKYAGRLNVRNTPAGKAITSIDFASIVSLQQYSDDGEWALVKVESKNKYGLKGWVSTDYLTCYQ